MHIGIPKEIKVLEGRVALVPDAVSMIIQNGHEVLIESGAGTLSGFTDNDYVSVGATVVSSAHDVYQGAELILKVKEPQPSELALLRQDHILFSYLHLAAEPELMSGLKSIGLTAIAFETVIEADGHLPLLSPMSDIAGRIAVQVGTTLLYQYQGGRGILLGGLPAASRGKVVILGAGVAGFAAARTAAALGAEVVVFDRNRLKLEKMMSIGNNVTALHSFPSSILNAVIQCDLLIGAILVPGKKATQLVSSAVVKQMKAGSVVVDISVDQGGCIETIHPTNYENPTYVWEEVVHFAVSNMPGAVPRSASEALSASLVPYVLTLAAGDMKTSAALKAGINVKNGDVVHPALLPQ